MRDLFEPHGIYRKGTNFVFYQQSNNDASIVFLFVGLTNKTKLFGLRVYHYCCSFQMINNGTSSTIKEENLNRQTTHSVCLGF